MDVPSQGFDPSTISSPKWAMQVYVIRLYRDTLIPVYPLNHNTPQHERNHQIVAYYKNNETLEFIAAKFHISLQRVHQIVKQRVVAHDDEQA